MTGVTLIINLSSRPSFFLKFSVLVLAVVVEEQVDADGAVVALGEPRVAVAAVAAAAAAALDHVPVGGCRTGRVPRFAVTVTVVRAIILVDSLLRSQ